VRARLGGKNVCAPYVLLTKYCLELFKNQITLVDWLERAVNLPTQLLNYGEYYTPLNQLSQNEELRSFTIDLLQRDDPFVLQCTNDWLLATVMMKGMWEDPNIKTSACFFKNP